MKRINVFLTHKQIAELKQLATESGMGYAEHIRRAIDAYLKRKAK